MKLIGVDGKLHPGSWNYRSSLRRGPSWIRHGYLPPHLPGSRYGLDDSVGRLEREAEWEGIVHGSYALLFWTLGICWGLVLSIRICLRRVSPSYLYTSYSPYPYLRFLCRDSTGY